MFNSISKMRNPVIFVLLFTISVMASAEEKVKVVASFSILGDLVSQIGGEYVEVLTLVGRNSDAHVYQARPSDAKSVSHADILVINGLGFEGWIDRLQQSSGFRGTKVVVSKNIHVRQSEEGSHDHDHGAEDPHAWHDIKNIKVYVGAITDALVQADPVHKREYESNRDDYLKQLANLDQELLALVSQIPAGKRKVITNHDAFGYLAVAYGFEFYAPQGMSTESEASARDVARLIEQIREFDIKAVFIENIADDRMMSRIAAETGAVIGGELYSGALSDLDGPAASYLDMMRHNVKTLVNALAD